MYSPRVFASNQFSLNSNHSCSVSYVLRLSTKAVRLFVSIASSLVYYPFYYPFYYPLYYPLLKFST